MRSTRRSRRNALSPRWCWRLLPRRDGRAPQPCRDRGESHLSAALLIADGDRIPDDTTVNIGTASKNPEKTGGAAQDWPSWRMPREVARECRRSTISVRDAGDAVCDYDPDADEVSATAAAIHTSYTVGGSNGQMWTWMVHQLLGSPSTPAPQVPEVATTCCTRRKKAPVAR